MPYTDTGKAIKELREKRKMNQYELAELASLNRVTIAKYESGKVEPGAKALSRIADALEVSVDEILGRDAESKQLPSGLLQMITGAVPMVGEIACGDAITAEENVEEMVSLPEGVHADFALRCRGTSMVPTFNDGDIVLIRQQEDANDGQIAAVLIDSEATLKRVRRIHGGIMLLPENTAEYSPMIYQGEEARCIRILGVAVGYVRMI